MQTVGRVVPRSEGVARFACAASIARHDSPKAIMEAMMAGILEGVRLHNYSQAGAFGLTSIRPSARALRCLLYPGARRSRRRPSIQLSAPRPSR
jgi:hypothetical protein